MPKGEVARSAEEAEAVAKSIGITNPSRLNVRHAKQWSQVTRTWLSRLKSLQVAVERVISTMVSRGVSA